VENVGEQHGLSAAQVRAGRDDDFLLEELLRASEDRAGQRADGRGGPVDGPESPEPQVERDLVVAGPARVDAAPRVARELDQAPFHVQVDVFIGVRETEPARLDLPRDGPNPPLDACQRRAAEELPPEEAARVGEGPGEVRLREAAVERVGDGQLREGGAGSRVEARRPESGGSLFLSRRGFLSLHAKYAAIARR
jgi:hypothetical protein